MNSSFHRLDGSMSQQLDEAEANLNESTNTMVQARFAMFKGGSTSNINTNSAARDDSKELENTSRSSKTDRSHAERSNNNGNAFPPINQKYIKPQASSGLSKRVKSVSHSNISNMNGQLSLSKSSLSPVEQSQYQTKGNSQEVTKRLGNPAGFTAAHKARIEAIARRQEAFAAANARPQRLKLGLSKSIDSLSKPSAVKRTTLGDASQNSDNQSGEVIDHASSSDHPDTDAEDTSAPSINSSDNKSTLEALSSAE
ncbi:hypothetical protein BJ742DRAFT_769730 [Cladochytrium replicatum]|nr:hypothetical protein BJ742DRAFT_769730 [Cladochytrium replicatum]